MQDAKRTISVVNLDPAAEFFNYQPQADIRDLIQVILCFRRLSPILYPVTNYKVFETFYY